MIAYLKKGVKAMPVFGFALVLLLLLAAAVIADADQAVKFDRLGLDHPALARKILVGGERGPHDPLLHHGRKAG